jgi:hypothetical protein
MYYKISNFEHVFLFLGNCMTNYLFVYDCIHARSANARRVSFTKELYGFNYSWKTKSGIKVRRKAGLMEECPGSVPVGESAIIVPSDHKSAFDLLFSDYADILTVRIFKVVEEQ